MSSGPTHWEQAGLGWAQIGRGLRGIDSLFHSRSIRVDPQPRTTPSRPPSGLQDFRKTPTIFLTNSGASGYSGRKEILFRRSEQAQLIFARGSKDLPMSTTTRLKIFLIGLFSAGCSSRHDDGLIPSEARASFHGDGGAAENVSRKGSSHHDFGYLLSEGQTVKHSFRTRTLRPARSGSSRAITRMPCRTTIGPLPEIIPVGGSIEVPISLKVGRATESKQVEFERGYRHLDRPAGPAEGVGHRPRPR